MSENLFAVFRSRFPADGSRLFLERPDGSTLTYGDLVDLSGQLANVLVALGTLQPDPAARKAWRSRLRGNGSFRFPLPPEPTLRFRPNWAVTPGSTQCPKRFKLGHYAVQPKIRGLPGRGRRMGRGVPRLAARLVSPEQARQTAAQNRSSVQQNGPLP